MRFDEQAFDIGSADVTLTQVDGSSAVTDHAIDSNILHGSDSAVTVTAGKAYYVVTPTP